MSKVCEVCGASCERCVKTWVWVGGGKVCSTTVACCLHMPTGANWMPEDDYESQKDELLTPLKEDADDEAGYMEVSYE